MTANLNAFFHCVYIRSQYFRTIKGYISPYHHDRTPATLLLLHSLDNSLKAKHLLNPLFPYDPLYFQPYAPQQLRPLLLRPFHAGEEHHCDIKRDVYDRGITGRYELLED